MIHVLITNAADDNPKHAQPMVEMTITDDGSGNASIGRYAVEARALQGPEVWRGRIHRHDRGSGVWSLLMLAIHNLRPVSADGGDAYGLGRAVDSGPQSP